MPPLVYACQPQSTARQEVHIVEFMALTPIIPSQPGVRDKTLCIRKPNW